MPYEASEVRRGPFPVRAVEMTDLKHIVALDEQITGIRKIGYWKQLIERSTKPSRAEQFFLVAEATDAPRAPLLGFIEGEIRAWEFGSAPCGWVYVLSVRPDVRLVGLGQTLLEALAAEFERAGVTKMRTMVLRDNRLVMQFFRAAGMMAGPYIELEKELG